MNSFQKNNYYYYYNIIIKLGILNLRQNKHCLKTYLNIEKIST